MSELLTPLKSIRAKCLDCSAGSLHEVRECPVTDCALYPYRLGKLPKVVRPKRTQTPAQKAAWARLQAAVAERRKQGPGPTPGSSMPEHEGVVHVDRSDARSEAPPDSTQPQPAQEAPRVGGLDPGGAEDSRPSPSCVIFPQASKSPSEVG